MRTPYRKPGKFSLIKPDPLMTEGKFAELKNKLARLKSVHPQAAAEVRRLAELGDFSENVEYQIAKGRLRGINQGILDVGKQLQNAVIITPDEQTDTVQLGHKVTIADGDKQKTYLILGSSETNPQKGVISHNSPIGAALMGHRAGEAVTVKIGNKETVYKILKIE